MISLLLGLFISISKADYTKPYIKRDGKLVQGYFHRHKKPNHLRSFSMVMPIVIPPKNANK